MSLSRRRDCGDRLFRQLEVARKELTSDLSLRKQESQHPKAPTSEAFETRAAIAVGQPAGIALPNPRGSSRRPADVALACAGCL